MRVLSIGFLLHKSRPVQQISLRCMTALHLLCCKAMCKLSTRTPGAASPFMHQACVRLRPKAQGLLCFSAWHVFLDSLRQMSHPIWLVWLLDSICDSVLSSGLDSFPIATACILISQKPRPFQMALRSRGISNDLIGLPIGP